MHTVTKILVVFAAVLCVLLAALTMAYSVNADTVVRDINVWKNKAATSDAANAATQAQFGNERTTLTTAKNDLANQLAALQAQITQLQAERSQLLVDKRAAEARADGVQNQIDQFTATNKTQTSLIENYRNEVTTLRDNELKWKQREIELSDRINDLDSQHEVLEGSVRALQEQLAEARRQIEQGGVAASAANAGSREPFTPTFAITGRVNEVKNDMATGAPMATINVGSNNQVRENMKLAITRGDKFIANIVIRKVDLQWSLGEIDYLSQKGVSVQAGDVVKSLASR